MNLQDFDFRFGGVSRSLGAKAVEDLRAAHVAVIGLGGVGSWAAEALVRTGVGAITLVDFDDICVSNINRQLQALTSTVGQMKTSALKARFEDISPGVQIHERVHAFEAETMEAFFAAAQYDVIIDCMDSLTPKCLLVNECRKRGIPLVVVGGSAGKLDPTRIRASDLAHTHGDRLLHKVRKKLRQDFGFPRKLEQKWAVPTIFSDEPTTYPIEGGCVTQEPEARPSLPLDCNQGLGSLTFVTGAFGFFAASEAVKIMVSKAAPTS